MTIQILLPTGLTSTPAMLNQHDLAQYYMYQMDMLEQASDILAALGLDAWRDGAVSPLVEAIARKRKHPSEFRVPPAEGNVLPTHYDASNWQGIVHGADGSLSYPFIENMTADQLRAEIERQQVSLTNMQGASAAFVNLARNIAAATQPPMHP